eukprot:1161661-Pelagomonas_calceolata.AAC.4
MDSESMSGPAHFHIHGSGYGRIQFGVGTWNPVLMDKMSNPSQIRNCSLALPLSRRLASKGTRRVWRPFCLMGLIPALSAVMQNGPQHVHGVIVVISSGDGDKFPTGNK